MLPSSCTTRRARLAACVLAISLAPAFAEAQQGPVTAPPPAPPLAPPPAAVCDGSELLRAGVVSGTGLEGFAQRVKDGQFAIEGAAWNAPQTVRLHDLSSYVLVDLQAPRRMQHFVLQGDDNDAFVLEGSLDGKTFTGIWTAPVSTNGPGLRTRWTSVPRAHTVQYLRARPLRGDSYFSVAELRAYCKRPAVWPPALNVPPKKPFWQWSGIDNPRMVVIKGWVAAAAALLLLSYVFLRKRPHVLRKTRALLLAGFGLFGFLSFWNIGHYHFDHYVHVWEHYHYYMGAKYGPELRYARLYQCTAAADISDGLRARVKKRNMRDLPATNELGPSDRIVAHPELCTQHFSPQRWEAYRKDNRFFRGQFSRERWDESQSDHGYNGTPVWGLAGRMIANAVDLSWVNVVRLSWIDTALLVLMWAVVWWAFGWQGVCVAALYWGLNFPARFYWNGGSFLRYDWQFWLVTGICLLKKRWHFGAGMALTYATLLRIFPGFVVAALVLKALARMVRKRKLVVSRSHAWFAAGCIVACAVLIPASRWSMNGLDAWPEFAQNSQKHLKTALTNNMGLKTVLGYDPVTSAKYMRNSSLSDPFKDWKDARAFYYAKRQPIMIALLVLFCILLARAGDREPDWSAACLGTGLIAMASELTCYYYGFLLAYGLMWERRKLPGIAATALAGLTCLFSETIGWNDDHFAAMSLATTMVVIGITAHVGFGKRPPAAP